MPYADLIRRVNDIERMVKRHVVSDHPGAGDVGRAYARFLAIPDLRALWAMSAFDVSGGGAIEIGDVGAFGEHLAGTGSSGVYGKVLPYYSFNGVDQYAWRASSTYTSISGNITAGGLFYFESFPPSGNERFLSKGETTSNNRAYSLFVNSVPEVVFYISLDGSITGALGSGAGLTVELDTWYWIVGRFTPGSEVACFLDRQKAAQTSGVPASCNLSTGNFAIGAQGDGTQPAHGRAALAFLAGSVLTDDYICDLGTIARQLVGG